MDKANCEALRRDIKAIADKVSLLRHAPVPGHVRDESAIEAVENMILAYRHLEDASMRLGKCIQALDGGVSVYDKDQVPAVREPAPMCPECGRNPLYQGHCGLCGYDAPEAMNG